MRDIRHKIDNLIYYQLDRIFIVRAPVNPLLVVQTSESLEDCGANFRRRLHVLRSIARRPREILIWNAKDKRMIRPELFVLQDHMLGYRPVAVASQNNRLHQRASNFAV